MPLSIFLRLDFVIVIFNMSINNIVIGYLVDVGPSLIAKNNNSYRPLVIKTNTGYDTEFIRVNCFLDTPDVGEFAIGTKVKVELSRNGKYWYVKSIISVQSTNCLICKKFSCSSCGSKFSSKASLSSHKYKYHHNKRKTVNDNEDHINIKRRCIMRNKIHDDIDEQYTVQNQEFDNMKIENGIDDSNSPKCSDCFKTYKNKNSLRAHRWRTHRLTCHKTKNDCQSKLCNEEDGNDDDTESISNESAYVSTGYTDVGSEIKGLQSSINEIKHAYLELDKRILDIKGVVETLPCMYESI